MDKSPAQVLATPLRFVKGVGPQRAELLARLGLVTARDLLFFFPRDYQDLTRVCSVAELEDGAVASVRGTVVELDRRPTSSGGSVVGVLVRQAAGSIRALWFNQPFMAEQFRAGEEVLLSGKVRLRGLVWEMPHPRVQHLGEDTPPQATVQPIYPLTEGLNQAQVRRAVERVLEEYLDVLEEVFPEEHLAAHGLWPIHRALQAMHFPASMEDVQQARRRFVYQELLVLQLALALKRAERGRQQAPPLEATARVDSRIRRLFPFELTAGQEAAIRDVSADMARSQPMNRLLQGDVGSGKTVVAVYAMLLAIAHGQQTALMAPTEILARQHHQTLRQVLAEARVRVGLLVGGLSPAERKALLAQIAAGEVDAVIGTQAIIQQDVEFARLGLVVIDEQHKFGVRQRASLKQAALAPHYLVMTATPIPRTVCMTLYGDLDVSVLRDAPPGRQPLHTYLATPEQRPRWWEFFRKKLREGRQGYVIVPVVEESAQRAAASLEATYENLANGELEEFRLGLLHGRMSPAEKEAAMEAFRQGRVQVLVSTTVVEVGVDVPNATLMTIEGGERFGLSQLHQLRGRVSRGAHPGFCCVFAEASTEESRERLEAFERSTDGFELAEIDFGLRGPGDLFGTKQHGLPPLRIADLRRDQAQLEEARQAAADLLAADGLLERPEHQRLRRMVLARYGAALELGDVG